MHNVFPPTFYLSQFSQNFSVLNAASVLRIDGCLLIAGRNVKTFVGVVTDNISIGHIMMRRENSKCFKLHLRKFFLKLRWAEESSLLLWVELFLNYAYVVSVDSKARV